MRMWDERENCLHSFWARVAYREFSIPFSTQFSIIPDTQEIFIEKSQISRPKIFREFSNPILVPPDKTYAKEKIEMK